MIKYIFFVYDYSNNRKTCTITAKDRATAYNRATQKNPFSLLIELNKSIIL